MTSNSGSEKGHLKITLSSHETLKIGDVEIRISNKGKRKPRSQTGLFITAPKTMKVTRMKDDLLNQESAPPSQPNGLDYAMSVLIAARESNIWFDFEARFIKDIRDRRLTFDQCSKAQQTLLVRLFRKLEASRQFGLIDAN